MSGVMKAARSHPVKIARIISRLNVGGPAIHVLWMTRSLEAAGYRTVLISGTEGPREGNMSRLAADLGVDPVIVPELKREISLASDIAAFLRILRLLRRERPDVVHTHTAKAGTLGRLAAWLAGVPVRVHTHHGHLLHGYFSPERTKTFVFIEKVLRRVTTHLITVSDTVRSDLIAAGIATPEGITTIPPGLPLAQFDAPVERGVLRRDLGIPQGDVVIGTVARLVPIKRLDRLLHAARILLSRRPHCRFVLVGDGELRPRLEETARELAIGERVSFAGFRPDMPAVYADLDVLALTSDNEGLPVSLVEGMAAGLPVVAAKVGGVPDLLTGVDSARMVDPPDPRRVADALDEVVSDLDGFKARAARHVPRVREQYSVERLAEDLDRLYRSLLVRKGVRHGQDPLAA